MGREEWTPQGGNHRGSTAREEVDRRQVGLQWGELKSEASRDRFTKNNSESEP